MNQSESQGKRDKDVILKRATAVITIVASIITIITGLLSWRDYIPDIVFIVFLILTVLLFLFLLAYFLVTVLGRSFLKKWKEAQRNSALARKHFDDLALLSDRLGELLRDNYVDNIPYIFSHLRNMPPEFHYPRSLIYDLANLVGVFKEAMKKVHKRDFPLLIKLFELMLRIYNSQLVLQPFQQIRNRYRDKLTEQEKDAYEKSRDNYVRFLQDYKNFARAINKDGGEKIAQDYFDEPGRLWKS